MYKNTAAITLTLALMLTLFVGLLSAAEPTGLELVENVYNRPVSDDMQSDLTMTLLNSRGSERVREIRQFINYGEVVEKKIMYFMSPADVRNTSFMNWSYTEPGRSDDQWLYLPALKKVKRTSSDSKGDYFMGSDFTYDDLGDRHPTSDTHIVIGVEELDGESCFVVESASIEEDYIYSRTRSWIVADKWVVLKKNFYDEDGELLKTLSVKKYENIDGFLVVVHSEMHNLQRYHKTIMILENIKLNQKLPDNKFTERMMTRGL